MLSACLLHIFLYIFFINIGCATLYYLSMMYVTVYIVSFNSNCRILAAELNYRFTGRRLAHASSLTYRFWGDASREESLFWVTPRARRHPKKCEASPQRLRGVTPKMEGWSLTSFSKITIFQKQTS